MNDASIIIHADKSRRFIRWTIYFYANYEVNVVSSKFSSALPTHRGNDPYTFLDSILSFCSSS
jgi:hypothetical protein